ncbi:MAG TPA: FtsL-like putative cell division protein [Bacteroidales bacterium]|nr:FtsL-like putative cell division protein [Bacteroidales bacterium]
MENEIGKDNQTGQTKNEGFIKSLISGTLVSEKLVLGNLGFLVVLTILGAIYIGNRFHAEKVIRRTDELQREVKELRADAIAISAELMYASKQSEVSRLLGQRGLDLEELKEPPYKLVIKK